MKIPSTDKVVKELIQEIKHMRYNNMFSISSLHDYLETKYNLNRTRRWELIKLAKEEIQDYHKTSPGEIEDAIEALEVMRQKCFELKDYKTSYAITKELNELKGLKVERIDLTSGGDKITAINVSIIHPDKKEEDKGGTQS